MSTRYYYQDFEKTESSEAYLRSQIQGVTDQKFKDGRYLMFVKTQENPERKTKRFSCEVRLDLPHSSPLFIKKEGDSFYQTVKSVGETLKKSVDKL